MGVSRSYLETDKERCGVEVRAGKVEFKAPRVPTSVSAEGVT